ncbi:hypothetical protein [Nonomuraea sp. NPDC003754]
MNVIVTNDADDVLMIRHTGNNDRVRRVAKEAKARHGKLHHSY